jgi:hypothetical protein
MHRREALQLFSLSALAAVAPLSRLGSVQREIFESNIFGIRATLPPGWNCLLVEDYLKLQEMDYGDENPMVPILSCMRFKEPMDGENDTFLIFAHRYSKADSGNSVCPNFERLDLENAEHKNYAVESKTVDGRNLSFERDAYFFESATSLFHVEFEYDAAKPERSASEFHGILHSIEVTGPSIGVL